MLSSLCFLNNVLKYSAHYSDKRSSFTVTKILYIYNISGIYSYICSGESCGAVGGGTAIPSGITEMFHRHSGPQGSTQTLTECREYFLGGEAGRCVGMSTLPSSLAALSGNLVVSTPWNPQGLNRDSVIGVMTRFVLDGSGIEFRLGARFSAHIQSDPGPDKHPVKWVPGLFPGVKQPERGFFHPPHLAPRLKKE